MKAQKEENRKKMKKKKLFNNLGTKPKKNRFKWIDAHDGMFTCRLCRRRLTDYVRSWTKIGLCLMCAGDLPSEKKTKEAMK